MGESSVLRAREILQKHAVDVLPDTARLSQVGASGDDAFFAAMLEAAFLVAAADGELSKEEAGSLADLVAQLGGETLSPGQLATMIDEFQKSLEKDGRLARIGALASSLPDPIARREVLGFAALLAVSDHDLAPSELYVLHAIGKGFELDANAVNGIIRSIKVAMGEG